MKLHVICASFLACLALVACDDDDNNADDVDVKADASGHINIRWDGGPRDASTDYDAFIVDAGVKLDSGTTTIVDAMLCPENAHIGDNGWCTCDSGYRSNSFGECVDIDECSEDSHSCNGEHMRCVNTEGSYECICDINWINVNGECVDEDECTTTPGICGTHGICANNAPGYTCTCESGWQRDTIQNRCVDINECATNMHDCGSLPCSNTEGGYECKCAGNATYNSSTGNCTCPSGLIYDNTLGCINPCGEHGTYTGNSCNCENGWFYSAMRGTCAPQCGSGTYSNGSCSCPSGWTYNSSIKNCTILTPITLNGGTYSRGTSSNPPSVTVPTFAISKTEVTFGQYQKCVDAGVCTAAHVNDGTCSVRSDSSWVAGILPESFQGSDKPVVCVDYHQAETFAVWAGGRLPTESEWEYAARGVEGRTYPWGNSSATCTYAQMAETTTARGCGTQSTANVCSKPAGNTIDGLCDMSGNVFEWVADTYCAEGAVPLDGSACTSGTNGVVRGGAWAVGASLQTATYRQGIAPSSIDSKYGIRVAFDVP